MAAHQWYKRQRMPMVMVLAAFHKIAIQVIKITSPRLRLWIRQRLTQVRIQ